MTDLLKHLCPASCKFTLRFLTAALIGMLLASCSIRSVVYNQLDWLIPWFFDDYVELSDEQREYLNQQLTPLLKWHREEELNRYIILLSDIESDLAVELKAETIDRWIDRSMQALKRSQQRLTTVGIDLLAYLDDEQIILLKQRLLEKQAELEQTYLQRSDAEYANDSYERLYDVLHDYLGYLKSNQETLLREACLQLKRFDRVWLSNRRAWLEKLLPLLDRKPGWEAHLRSHVDQRYEKSNVAYKQTLSHNLNLITNATALLLNRRDASQQQHLSAELASLQDELQALSVHPTNARPYSEK